MLEARYKTLSKGIINSYNNELILSQEVECFLRRGFKTFKNAKELTGGKISSVYKLDDDGQKRVMK